MLCEGVGLPHPEVELALAPCIPGYPTSLAHCPFAVETDVVYEDGTFMRVAVWALARIENRGDRSDV